MQLLGRNVCEAFVELVAYSNALLRCKQNFARVVVLSMPSNVFDLISDGNFSCHIGRGQSPSLDRPIRFFMKEEILQFALLRSK